jgi:hypothetical protein
MMAEPQQPIMKRQCSTTSFVLITVALLVVIWLPAGSAGAFDFSDMVEIGSAYMTHLYVHELGHQVMADSAGAEGHEMRFLSQKNGQFYLGLSTYETIPDQSKLPYAVAGEKFAGITFEYALNDYREHPTTYNKALLFFSSVDFVLYTLLGNYVNPDDTMYDPNLIREQTGMGKEMLLGVVLTKSLLNGYRVINEDARLIPWIRTDDQSAAFMLSFRF